jgi:hypothetical protein
VGGWVEDVTVVHKDASCPRPRNSLVIEPVSVGDT